MSEEEIIDTLQILEDNDISRIELAENIDLRTYQLAVNNLLDLYNKEKEKNKELESEINNWKFTAKYVEENYIDKRKIMSKINKLQNSEILEDNISIPYLKELLEE